MILSFNDSEYINKLRISLLTHLNCSLRDIINDPASDPLSYSSNTFILKYENDLFSVCCKDVLTRDEDPFKIITFYFHNSEKIKEDKILSMRIHKKILEKSSYDIQYDMFTEIFLRAVKQYLDVFDDVFIE